MKEVIDFLKQLKVNNNREWFEANKAQYLKAKSLYDDFVNQIIDGIRVFDPTIGKLEAKDCTFRIYRDVRFSPNKDPYKDQMGAYIARGGRKSTWAGYYIHLEPDNCFTGGGIYMPPPDVLKSVRNEIYFNAADFLAIFSDKNFKKYYAELYEDKLSRPPKDFDIQSPVIEYLKYKSYFADTQISMEKVYSDKLVSFVLDAMKAVLPLTKFLNKAFEK